MQTHLGTKFVKYSTFNNGPLPLPRISANKSSLTGVILNLLFRDSEPTATAVNSKTALAIGNIYVYYVLVATKS